MSKLNVFLDGDSVVVTLDDFIDLQQSPALFFRKTSAMGKKISGGQLSFIDYLQIKASLLIQKLFTNV